MILHSTPGGSGGGGEGGGGGGGRGDGDGGCGGDGGVGERNSAVISLASEQTSRLASQRLFAPSEKEKV